jgi:hypothetical protein
VFVRRIVRSRPHLECGNSYDRTDGQTDLIIDVICEELDDNQVREGLEVMKITCLVTDRVVSQWCLKKEGHKH